MDDSEPISEMFTLFSNIMNDLKALYKNIPNIELVNKILISIPKKWNQNLLLSLRMRTSPSFILMNLLAPLLLTK